MNIRGPRFVTFSSFGLRGHRWYFRFEAANGEPVFQSEAYNSAAARDRGIEAARKCHNAAVVREG